MPSSHRLTLLTLLATTLILTACGRPFAEEPSMFVLAENGTTILCPDAEIGAEGVVDGVTYTKRALDDVDGVDGLTTLVDNGAGETGWDLLATSCTSGIENMSGMFYQVSSFNQNIGSWDTSSVTNMSGMFNSASNFNQNVGSFNTSSVTNMNLMFADASNFDQDLSGWCVSSFTGKPPAFDFGADAWTGGDATRPQWGTCPTTSTQR